MHKLLLNLPDCLETERLILRPYQAGDGEAYYAVCIANKSHLLPFEAGNSALAVNTPEEAEVLVRQFAVEWAARTMFMLGGWAKLSGAWVAQIYTGVVNWELPEFEMGYWVDQGHEGHGYVTEGMKAALGMVFGPLGARRVRLGCNELNVRSARVAERCGFVREGYIRGTHPNLPRSDGSASGDYMYGLLREDYQRVYGQDTAR
jgi:ribosomal-protein-serine acetyltransferase